MSGRDANQLAADVRERLRPVQGLDGVQCQCEECVDNAAGFSALDELVALVTDLEARLRDAESITYSGLVTRTLQRAEAAEAQVAALTTSARVNSELADKWQKECGRLGDEVAALTQERDAALEAYGEVIVERGAAEAALAEKGAALTNMTGWHNEAQARVNELEAALATTRQALTEIARRGDGPKNARENWLIARRALADTGGGTAEEGT